MTSLLPKSALARTLDFSYPSNRYAAGGLVAGVLLSRLLGRGWQQALEDGLAGFVAWATARELDPDHAESAAVALPLALAGALAGQTSGAVAGFASLAGLRALTATVGYAPTMTDTAGLLALSGLAAATGSPVAAALPGAALGVSAGQQDRFSPAPESVLMAAAALLPAHHRFRDAAGHNPAADLLSLAALATLVSLSQPEQIDSDCDQSETKVVAERVERARQLALVALGAGLVLRQTRSLAPLAAATLGVGLRRFQAGR